MVNAVLRKAVMKWPATLERSSVDVRLAHPWWIYDRWSRRFGDDACITSMASAQEPAVTWVWFLDEAARDRLQGEGVELEQHPWCPGAVSAPGNPAALIREVISGTAYAQDPSSLLVARVGLDLVGSGGSFVDLCAAPGGKAAFLMRRGSWSRAAVAELRPSRARLVSALLQNSGPSPVVVADAKHPPFAPGGWHFVLLDAPCSGTGTFRRHPEIKWRLQPESVAELAGLQRELFRSALDLVAPGGVLLYATCSVESEENEGVVDGIDGGFEVVDLSALMPESAPWRSTGAGGARILPNANGDGFTMHTVRRVR
jgi:16S rRNA (cytosine967-C5)-methyltransferase